MEIDITNNCRICLSEKEEMHDIFVEYNDGYSLADIAENIFHSDLGIFAMRKNDGLSSFLCQDCIKTIVDFFNLKVTYQESQNYVTKLLEKSQPYVEFKDEKVKLESTYKSEEESESDNSNDESIIINNVSSKNVQSQELDFENSVGIQISTSNNKQVSEGGSVEEECYFIIEGTEAKENELTIKEADDELDDKPTKNYDSDFEIKVFRSYSCPYCIKHCFDFKHFQKHMKEYHECDIVAPDMFSTTVEKMQIKKKGVSGYVCHICGKIFEDESTFAEHIHIKYLCEKCGLGFKKKSYLDDHKEIHESVKRHICNYCNKAFQTRTVLVKHKRIHTNPRELVCQMCGRAFTDRGTLKTHIMLLHTKERNFKCVICSETFSLKSTLQKHVLRHRKDREKAFYCDECEMCYRDKSSLQRHLAMKHCEDNYKVHCNCGKEYTSTANLRRHMKKHHSTADKHK